MVHHASTTRFLHGAYRTSFFHWKDSVMEQRQRIRIAGIQIRAQNVALRLLLVRTYNRSLSIAFNHWNLISKMENKQRFLIEGAYYHKIQGATILKNKRTFFQRWLHTPRMQRAMVLRTYGRHGNGFLSMIHHSLTFSHYYLSAL